MTRWIVILVMIFFAKNIFGQTKSAETILLPTLTTFQFKDVCLDDRNFFSNKLFTQNTTTLYKADHLPSLFCKMEYKLEQKSKLAPRFRLGSLEYTEFMEGKRRYYFP